MHARAIVFTPRVLLDVALAPTEFNQDTDPGAPHPSSSVGVVLGSRKEGEDQIAVGNGQAWYYPCDRLLVLWEMELFHGYDPGTGGCAPSEALAALWRDFETLLRARFPQAAKILTPAWEPEVEREQWQAFLGEAGFGQDPQIENAFFKSVGEMVEPVQA